MNSLANQIALINEQATRSFTEQTGRRIRRIHDGVITDMRKFEWKLNDEDKWVCQYPLERTVFKSEDQYGYEFSMTQEEVERLSLVTEEFFDNFLREHSVGIISKFGDKRVPLMVIGSFIINFNFEWHIINGYASRLGEPISQDEFDFCKKHIHFNVYKKDSMHTMNIVSSSDTNHLYEGTDKLAEILNEIANYREIHL